MLQQMSEGRTKQTHQRSFCGLLVCLSTLNIRNKGNSKVEARLSLRRSCTRRYPVLDNRLHTGSFASDFAASSASHLANFASFSRLSASGVVASRCIFRQLGERGDCIPRYARLISCLISASSVVDLTTLSARIDLLEPFLQNCTGSPL